MAGLVLKEELCHTLGTSKNSLGTLLDMRIVVRPQEWPATVKGAVDKHFGAALVEMDQ